jgi:hypothetical protein
MGTAPSVQTASAVVKPAVMIAWTIMTTAVIVTRAFLNQKE